MDEKIPINPTTETETDHPDDREKEERRRVAQKVLGKQG